MPSASRRGRCCSTQGEPCDICQHTSSRPLFARLSVTQRNKDDMGDGVPTDRLSHNHCDCTDSHCNSRIVLPFVPSPITSPSAAGAAQRLRRDEEVLDAPEELRQPVVGVGGAQEEQGQERRFVHVVYLARQSRAMVVAWCVGFLISLCEQAIIAAAGRRLRRRRKSQAAGAHVLFNLTPRPPRPSQDLSFLHAREQAFFSLLAFTQSYCHPRHTMACSFGTLSQRIRQEVLLQCSRRQVRMVHVIFHSLLPSRCGRVVQVARFPNLAHLTRQTDTLFTFVRPLAVVTSLGEGNNRLSCDSQDVI